VAQVIAVNAVHPGSGVSTTVANVAALLAKQGIRVGVVDACLAAPTLHLLFDLPAAAAYPTINEFLLGQCSLAATAQRVLFNSGSTSLPPVVLVPADANPATVAKVHSLHYNIDALGTACQQLASDLSLDVLIVDTESGLPSTTLHLFAAASTVLIVLALDKQQYQGVARTVAVVEALNIPRRQIAVNSVAPQLDHDNVRASVSQTYGWEVTGIIPYCDELMALASASLFVQSCANHPVTAHFRHIADRLLDTPHRP
jgi:MinD-like ATPase involved in chromosome partitioning or flagellar assembly